MCKYCEIDKESKYASKPLADGKYEACRIVIYDGSYCISVYGSGENWSDPIKFCPFCGRELKVEENKTEGFSSIWDYLSSLNDGTREGINYEKWRYGIDYYTEHRDISIEDFINHIEKKFNRKK